MRKSKIEQLKERQKAAMKPMALTIDGLLALLVAPNYPENRRKLNPTQRDFIYDTRRITAYMGAAGVAKTSTLCAKGLIRALTVPDTRLLVARYDYNDLILTTGKRLEEMLLALPKGTLIDRAKDPPMRWWVKPIAMNGESEPEPSEIVFMGLKENLGSFEFTDAIIDEADECEQSAVQLVDTRLRYVRKGWEPEEHSDMYSLSFAFNPPDTTHWLYTACTGRDFQEKVVAKPWVDHLYTPIPNENSDNLPKDYHQKLGEKLPEDLRARLVKGEWGAVFPGQPVFREFSRSTHASKRLTPESGTLMMRFWDFGYRNPFCIWAQMDWEGRLLCFKELHQPNTEATAFGEMVLKRSAKWFPNHKRWIDFGDPAVNQKKDTGQTQAALMKIGILIRSQTSEIEDGLRVIRKQLETLIGGEPAIQIDPQGCPIFTRALQGGYHIDEKTGKPKKDGFYDHPADAFRYGCINVFGIGSMSTIHQQLHSLPSSVAYSGD